MVDGRTPQDPAPLPRAKDVLRIEAIHDLTVALTRTPYRLQGPLIIAMDELVAGRPFRAISVLAHLLGDAE